MTRTLRRLPSLVVLAPVGFLPLFGLAQAPVLGIQQMPGEQVILFWPQGSGSFVLESTENLGASANWVTVTGQPSQQGNNWTLTKPAAGAPAYFRLKGSSGAIEVESAAVSYLNAVPEIIPAGTVETRDSLVVSFLNALPALVPAGTIATFGSAPVSYLNAAPAPIPTGTAAALTSLPVSYLNAVPVRFRRDWAACKRSPRSPSKSVTDPYTVLNAVATDNAAKQISCSWSWSYGPTHKWAPGHGNYKLDAILSQMAAQGQSFFQASGDSDARARAEQHRAMNHQGSDEEQIPAIGSCSRRF